MNESFNISNVHSLHPWFSAEEKAGMKLLGLNFDDPASTDAVLEAAALVGPAAVEQVHWGQFIPADFLCFQGSRSKVLNLLCFLSRI